MRKIDWDGPLDADDLAFLRQTGILGIEDRIAAHQAKFGQDVEDPEIPEDEATKSALDPSAHTGEPQPNLPGPVDPTNGGVDPEADEVEDDYDTPAWSKSDLESEVEARNQLETRKTDVVVVGTGKDGNVLKTDLVKALRIWDSENPEA